jgi:hypothetical protein
LHLGSASYSFAGKFSAEGAASKTFNLPGQNTLTVDLQLDMSNGPMTGTVSEDGWTADLVADPAIYSSVNRAPEAGKYTLLIPGNAIASDLPGGNGYGAVTVSPTGAVTFSGVLGDGTPFTSSSVVSADGQWPFYVSLYGGKGSALGWLTFSNNAITGLVGWFKQPLSTAKLYSAGFTNNFEIIGSSYEHTNGVALLDFTQGQLVLTNGDLAEGGITNEIGVSPAVELVGTGADENMVKLTFNNATGLFHGTVVNPATGKPIVINGAVLQNQDLAAGYFAGATETGSVLLAATPAPTPSQ